MKDDISSSKELISELDRSTEQQKAALQSSADHFNLIITHLDSQQKQITEIGLRIDHETAKRREIEQDILELRRSVAGWERTLSSLRQAITESDQKQRELALAAAEIEREVQERLDREAVPIKTRLKQLEAQRLSIEQRMEAVINNPLKLRTGDSHRQSEKWLQEDLALKKQLLSQLDAEAAVVDNAIAAQQAKLERIYGR